MEYSKEDNEAVEWCENSYPELCTEYKKIMMEQYVLFCKKHRNYGTGNINVGTNLETDNDVKLALTGLWFRLNDKVQRLKQLVVLGEPDTVGEAIDDTFQDLSIYGIIAQLVKEKKFKSNLEKPNRFRILTGYSVARLSRLLWEQEVASSNLATPTIK